jgi:hypothetical protein
MGNYLINVVNTSPDICKLIMVCITICNMCVLTTYIFVKIACRLIDVMINKMKKSITETLDKG